MQTNLTLFLKKRKPQNLGLKKCCLERSVFQLEGLRQAVIAGYKALTRSDGGALHAAAATVAVLEDHWAFNAGYGSVLNEVKKQSFHTESTYERKTIFEGYQKIREIERRKVRRNEGKEEGKKEGKKERNK